MSRRDDLETMRTMLLAAAEQADAAVLAQIVGQLRIVVKELAELPEAKADSPLDNAKGKRAARRAHLKAV